MSTPTPDELSSLQMICSSRKSVPVLYVKIGMRATPIVSAFRVAKKCPMILELHFTMSLFVRDGAA